jgi:hypothetical protein
VENAILELGKKIVLNVELSEVDVGEEPSVMEFSELTIGHGKELKVDKGVKELEGEICEGIVVKDELGDA